MKENIVIGVEGDIASGKTSICEELTNLIDNSIFVDGGSLYRGIIHAMRNSGIDLKAKLTSSDAANLNPLEIMKKLNVEMKLENRKTEVYIDGEKIGSDELTNEENSLGTSSMAYKSDNSALFMFARKTIENYRKDYNVIVSARDLVEIYPDMTCHVFIKCSLPERVNRRFLQYGCKISKEKVEQIIKKRELLHEKAGFNKTCANTIKVDITECKNSKESSKKVYEAIKSFVKSK